MESIVHDMPVEACAVPRTRHRSETNGSATTHTHRMATRAHRMATRAAETSAESATVAAAATAAATMATSGKDFAWSKNYESARERDHSRPVHARLHVQRGCFAVR